LFTIQIERVVTPSGIVVVNVVVLKAWIGKGAIVVLKEERNEKGKQWLRSSPYSNHLLAKRRITAKEAVTVEM
jgi:hypothetical protein